jgi:hypothetical protein
LKSEAGRDAAGMQREAVDVLARTDQLGLGALGDQAERVVRGDQVAVTVNDHRRVRQVSAEDVVDRRTHGGQHRVVE